LATEVHVWLAEGRTDSAVDENETHDLLSPILGLFAILSSVYFLCGIMPYIWCTGALEPCWALCSLPVGHMWVM